EGKGDYCLYHGNLSVIENEKAACWLCEKVFSELNIRFLIAGKAPSKKLKVLVKQNQNISLLPDPSKEELDQLIGKAQINILPSFNATGIKIKLLSALSQGRHCLVNKATIEGTELGSLCQIAETADEFKKAIKRLFEEPFSSGDILKREELLSKNFDNKKNAELLIQWIY
ncbi:MAG TPA: glycosyltransferase family 4 protein, partial [Chitinophagaceae bacterium]|nr:glycosyltransferase family 4 protein [Chitinophagaceae bacterium]